MSKVNVSDLTKRQCGEIQEEVSDEPRRQGKRPHKQKAAPPKEVTPAAVSPPIPERPTRKTKLLRTLPPSSIVSRRNAALQKRQCEEVEELPVLPPPKRTRRVNVFEYFCKFCDRKFASKAPIMAHVTANHLNELIYVIKCNQDKVQNETETITESGVNVNKSGSVLNQNDLPQEQLEEEDLNDTENNPPHPVNQQLEVQKKQAMIVNGNANVELKHASIPTKQILFPLPPTATCTPSINSETLQGQSSKTFVKASQPANQTLSKKKLSWRVRKYKEEIWYGCFYCEKEFKSTVEIKEHSLNTHVIPQKQNENNSVVAGQNIGTDQNIPAASRPNWMVSIPY